MRHLLSVSFAIFLAHTCHAQINVTSLPLVCNKAGQTYVIANDLTSSSGAAITVQADNVKIDGNGKTLTFGTGSAGGTGIRLSQSVDNLEVFNLRIVQGSGGGRAFESNSNQVDGLKLHDLQIVSENVVSSGIRLSNLPKTSGISISRNTISVNGISPGSGNGIYIEGDGGTITGAVSQNTITLGNKVEAGRSACIVVTGFSGPLEIWGNTLNMYHGYQGEGLQSWNASDNIIRDNTVNMHCMECRGLLIDGASNGNRVYGNKIYQNPSDGFQYGIRVRYASSNNEIYNNLVQGAAGNHDRIGIYLGESQLQTWPIGPPVNNRIVNNTFICGKECISIRQGSESNYFGCNKIQASEGEAIYVLPYDQAIRNLTFVNNIITVSAGNQKVVFDPFGTTSHPANPVVFCGGDILASQITGDSGTDYVIQAPPCSQNCSAPSAPKNLVVRK
jgi:hypothetical protein